MQVFLKEFFKKIQNMNYELFNKNCKSYEFLRHCFKIPKNLFEYNELKVIFILYKYKNDFGLETKFEICEKKDMTYSSIFCFEKNLFDDKEFKLWFEDLFENAYFLKFNEEL